MLIYTFDIYLNTLISLYSVMHKGKLLTSACNLLWVYNKKQSRFSFHIGVILVVE